MGVDEAGVLRVAAIARRAGVVDALIRLRDTIDRVFASILTVSVLDRITATVVHLGPSMKAIATMARVLASLSVPPELLHLVQALYEAVLQILAALPGGWRLARAFRAIADPVLYPGDGRPVSTAVVCCAPPSRVSSPRRLVSRSSRSLRGPSAALAIPHQSLGAALT